MTKAIPVIFATLALAGCMTSYPLWEPPVPEPLETTAPPQSVTIEGRVVEIDADEQTMEIETTAEGTDSWIRVEFADETVVYASASRDESAEGADGLELIDEDDRVSVSGLRRGDTVVAREISLVGNEIAAAAPKRPAAAPAFQPRDRVPGIVRSIDTEVGRIVLETAEHGMIAVYCDGDTPVFYLGGIFRVTNLEVGDGVTVTIGATDEGDPATPWVTAIDVTRSVSHDGPPPPAKRDVTEVTEPAVQLETIEILGEVKRLEKQGFEIEVEGGELRYVTADPMMRLEDCGGERVSGLKVGMSLNVRALEVGDRVVAQQINCVSRAQK